ncbi:hypothetical protein [Sphingobium sp. YBL2]|nr:hypothetical protein [Sphingobium sp. YBL2]
MIDQKRKGDFDKTGNAAVAHAVWHATGRGIRKLPVRIEHLL